MLRLSTFVADVLAALANAASAVVGGPVTINDASTNDTGSLVISAPNNSAGVNVKLTGNGATTPSKWLRVINGVLQVLNNSYGTAIASLNDAGNWTVAGSIGIAGSSGPTWTSGSGAPTSTQPNGSLYSRSDGTLGNRLYVSTGSAWNAVMSV